MNFVHNLNIIQHHNNELHKHFSELYINIEKKLKQLEEKEENIQQREKELEKKLEEIENFNKVSIIKTQDKKIKHLERRVSQLSIKNGKLDKQNKKNKKKEKNEIKQKLEKTNTKQTDETPETPETLENNKQVEEVKTEPELESDYYSESDEEFEIKKIGKKNYYISDSKEVYTILDNEDVGDCIGILKNKKLVRYKKNK